MKLLIINGPNINMLGIREPGIYGSRDFKALLALVAKTADELGIKAECFQSNYEGALVTAIQQAYGKVDGIVINPGAYTHTSIAILDALKSVQIPTVEVHISDVSKREDFRQVSYVRLACVKTIMGQGIDGYRQAMVFLQENYAPSTDHDAEAEEISEKDFFKSGYRAEFTVEGILYHSVDQYCAAKAALAAGDFETYRAALHDEDAKAADGVTEEMLFNATLAKFTQNPSLRREMILAQNEPVLSVNPLEDKVLKRVRAELCGGMLYTELTKKALCIAYKQHKKARDKANLPYVFHPYHLAERMGGDEYAICAALLHDVVEDSGMTIDDLKEAGFPREVTDAVALLTHNRKDDYLEVYIQNLKSNPIARKIKLEDLTHNMNTARIGDAVGPKAEADRERRMAKYREAMGILTDIRD